tara:strand:+ start:163 stop:453 length:291 start_codon:yes stop_codon:yes gene_type:complete
MTEPTLSEMNEKIDRIEQKIDMLLEKMEISVKECNKMGEHIDFIENVYDTVKFPLSYICDKVNVFSGSDTNSLENIEPVNRLIEDEFDNGFDNELD